MARIVTGSPADHDLRAFTDLRDVQLRQAFEGDQGIYLAEGEKVVRRAVQAGHQPVSFLMAPRWLEPLADVLATTDAPCHLLDDGEIETLTGFHVHRGALAAMRRPAPVSPDALLATAGRVVVIEDLADHANVGAVFRNAAAFGWDAVLLSPRCADPYYRRAIKVSMGTVFAVPFARVDDWYDAPDLLHRHGFMSLAMTLGADAESLEAVEPAGRIALIVGSEGHGLTPRWESGATRRVTIDMAPGVDSLNVAASVAVACWHLRRR